MQSKLLKIFTGLVVLLALAFPFVLALEKIHESDTFWHLKTGEWILTHHEIPRVDSYSSTVPGKPWLDWEWLFQAGMYVVYKAGGFNALVVVKALMAALTGLLIFQSSRRNAAGPMLAATAVMLAFVASRERLEMRPDLAFLLFAAAFVAVLETERQGRHGRDARATNRAEPSTDLEQHGRDARATMGTVPKWLWCLPALQVLWVNCHASFPLGICLVGAYVVGGFVDSVVNFDGPRMQFAPTVRMLAVLALVALACLLNPYGIALIEHAVSQTGAASPAGAIGEWQPTRELLLTEPNWALRVFWWLFWLNPILLLGRLVVERRRFPWAHALVVAGMSALALRANRFTAVYAVVTAPILAGAVAQVLKKIAAQRRVEVATLSKLHPATNEAGPSRLQTVPTLPEPVRWIAALAVGALAVFLIGVVVTNRWAEDEDREPRFGWGVDETTVPFRALSELNRLPASMGLFNTFPSGGPLIWKSVPPWLVFTDGRANLYGREFVDRYRAAMHDPEKWETWMRQRDISAVFVQYGTADDSVLLQHLAQNPGWLLYYFDQAACLFTRTSRAEAQVAWDNPDATWKYAVGVANRVAGADKDEWGRAMATMGNFLMVCGKVEAAERLFNEAVGVNPHISEAWMNLGLIERNRGHLDRAKEIADRLLDQNPDYYPARLMRAEIEAAQGNVGAALTEVDAVLWRVPHSAQAWFKRAQLAAQQGDRDKAIRSLQRVVAEGIEDPTVYWFLARLLAHEGKREEALRAYANCLRVWVGAPEKKVQVEAEMLKLRAGEPAR